MKKYNYEDLTAETLMEMVREVNSWDGSLGEFDYWVNNEEFFDMFFGGRPLEAVRAAYYGDYRDADEYVRIDSLENLESASEWALSNRLLGAAEEITEKYMDLVNDGSIENYAGVSIDYEEE